MVCKTSWQRSNHQCKRFGKPLAPTKGWRPKRQLSKSFTVVKSSDLGAVSPSPETFRHISNAIIPFIASQRRDSKPSNFAVLLVFLTLRTCNKISFSKRADSSLTTDYSGLSKNISLERIWTLISATPVQCSTKFKVYGPCSFLSATLVMVARKAWICQPFLSTTEAMLKEIAGIPHFKLLFNCNLQFKYMNFLSIIIMYVVFYHWSYQTNWLMFKQDELKRLIGEEI